MSGSREQTPTKRRAYRYVLHNYEGSGTYLSESETLEQVKNELLDMFGDKLYMVEGEVVNGTYEAD